MGVVYIKTDQGSQITSGTGVPTHTAVAGDRYTDTATGLTYQYTTSWQAVSYGSGSSVNIYNTDGTLTADRTVSGDAKILTFDNVRREVHNVVPNFNDATGFIINVDAGALSPFLTSRMFRIVDTTTTTEKFGINVNGNVVINNAYTLPLTDGSNGQVLKTNGFGDVTWGIAAGLTYFTEAQNTTAPNATVPVDSLTAVSATTNADVAIVPKGTGAIIAAIPDGTATGGNKRGANAVDLQTTRNQPTHVASGSQSAVLGGYGNRASGGYSTVIGGYLNSAIAEAAVATGFSNSALGGYSFVGGSSSSAGASYDFTFGQSCVSSGSYANVCMGAANTVTNGLASIAIGNGIIINGNGGGSYNHFAAGGNHRITAYQNSVALGNSTIDNGSSKMTYGSAGYVRGDAQNSKVVLLSRTTTNTPVVMVTSLSWGLTANSYNQFYISNNNSIRFKGTIIGRQSGSTNTSAWDIDGIIQRGTSAATTTLILSNINVVQNTPAWGTPTITADTSLGCLTVSVIGALTTNIQWTCAIDTTEVIYA